MSSGTSLLTDPYEKACILNDHLGQQCSATAPADFADVCQLPSAAGPQFNFANISPADVTKKLCGLASGKSCGPDGITNMLLKLAAGSISDSISSLFNHSLAEGVFPATWKTAVISPVPKEGKDFSFPTSYRIALLCSLSKVLEYFVNEQLVAYCMEQGVFPDEQFGFLRGRSTEWQLLSVLEDWHTCLDNKYSVHAIFWTQ